MSLSKSMTTSMLVAMIAILATGCTTANFGMVPTSVQEKKDTFLFKMYVGGFSGVETSDAAVKNDIESYQKSNGFSGHKILGKRYNLIPSYFEYTVQFGRD